MVLIYQKKQMIPYPTIPKFDRTKVEEKQNNQNQIKIEAPKPLQKLSRSGRSLRPLNQTSANLYDRTWNLPKQTQSYSQELQVESDVDHYHKAYLTKFILSFQPLNQREILAEVVYVSQPMVHLAAYTKYGNKSWKPWMASMGMDLVRYTYMYED